MQLPSIPVVAPIAKVRLVRSIPALSPLSRNIILLQVGPDDEIVMLRPTLLAPGSYQPLPRPVAADVEGWKPKAHRCRVSMAGSRFWVTFCLHTTTSACVARRFTRLPVSQYHRKVHEAACTLVILQSLLPQHRNERALGARQGHGVGCIRR